MTDGLRAEREQGITIDVAYRYFATPLRKFIIADTPGHVQYTRNMVTGNSTADLTLVLVDARKGIVEQTRRHAFLASLLRVPHLVVCVNKMDLVDYDQQVFESIRDESSAFASRLEITDLTFIPISALEGDNVVQRSANMTWYEGASLLHHLETVYIAADRNLIDPRMPVQWVVRPKSAAYPDYRGYAGMIAGGVFRPGDDVMVVPSGLSTTITAIDSFDGPVEEAFAPMSVVVRLEQDLDISRGDVLCRPHNQPTVGQNIDAMVCWMIDRPVRPGDFLALKHTTRWVRAVVSDIHYRLDVNTLHRDESASVSRPERGREADPQGHATDLLRQLPPEPLDGFFHTGGRGHKRDVRSRHDPGAGLTAVTESSGSRASAANLTWHAGRMSREERWDALSASGGTVWFTGLSGSGKSTLAAAVELKLVSEGRPAYRLDGDNLRSGLNSDLDFSRAGREENIRRVAEVACLFADAGVIALVALISPYRASREHARSEHERLGLPFVEVHMAVPIEVCAQRDPKGLYAERQLGTSRLSPGSTIRTRYLSPRSSSCDRMWRSTEPSPK